MEVPTSKYLFRKVLPKTDDPIFHYFCKKCSAYIGEKTQLLIKFPSKLLQCNNCRFEFNINSKVNACYFIQLKLKSQLLNIITKFKESFTKQRNSEDSTDNNDNTYNDVTSGTYYESIKKENPCLLSLTFNTDGVKIFN